MALNFKLLSILWIVVTIVSPTTAAAADPTTAAAADPTAAAADPTTAAAADPTTTAAAADPTTTTTTAAAADPTTTTTTAAAADPTTTTTTAAAADPTTTTTTAAAADPTTTTTAAAADPTTTAAAADPTTTAAAADPTTTTAAAGSPGPFTTTMNSSTTPVPTTAPDPCFSNPCGFGSTCQPRANQTFVCLCLPGEFYSNETGSCATAKVFPGQLKVPDIKFDEKMNDTSSTQFREASNTIIAKLGEIFGGNKTYSGSIVLKLEQPVSGGNAKSGSGVMASVQIFFSANSDVTINAIKDQMTNANLTFEKTNLCTESTCDSLTAACEEGDGTFICNCKEGYKSTDFSKRICVTACPNGGKYVNSKCVSCSIGYTGFNCQDKWQLILIIVGSVLGGLLLISLILLPVVAFKTSKKSSKKNGDANMEQTHNHNSTKEPLYNSRLGNSQAPSVNGQANGFAPRIPRATTTSSWDNRSNFEMTPGNSQSVVPMSKSLRLYDDPDDMNPYSQNRAQNNPYAQSRPKINPYAQNQGHSNPYYTHDDGRRFN